MGLEEQWKVLSDLILVLRKNGVEIPSQVMKDLHSAKIMISLLGTKGSDESEILPRVESYLSSVEGFLFYAAEEKLGKSVAAEWVEKISRARRTPEKETEGAAERGKFIAGLRRGEGWVRIEEYDTSLSDEIEAIARQEGLQVSFEPSGHMLIRGDSESIRQAIKRIREKARRR
ncbi:MAG: DUF2096 domain-containing protein [Aigarchaeota archaeon]|nr:DUF2096 domain-containing protein [Aigarchaeota archaeon]